MPLGSASTSGKTTKPQRLWQPPGLHVPAAVHTVAVQEFRRSGLGMGDYRFARHAGVPVGTGKDIAAGGPTPGSSHAEEALRVTRVDGGQLRL